MSGKKRRDGHRGMRAQRPHSGSSPTNIPAWVMAISIYEQFDAIDFRTGAAIEAVDGNLVAWWPAYPGDEPRAIGAATPNSRLLVDPYNAAFMVRRPNDRQFLCMASDESAEKAFVRAATMVASLCEQDFGVEVVRGLAYAREKIDRSSREFYAHSLLDSWCRGTGSSAPEGLVDAMMRMGRALVSDEGPEPMFERLSRADQLVHEQFRSLPPDHSMERPNAAFELMLEKGVQVFPVLKGHLSSGMQPVHSGLVWQIRSWRQFAMPTPWENEWLSPWGTNVPAW